MVMLVLFVVRSEITSIKGIVKVLITVIMMIIMSVGLERLPLTI